VFYKSSAKSFQTFVFQNIYEVERYKNFTWSVRLLSLMKDRSDNL